jgi:hypothetical protein
MRARLATGLLALCVGATACSGGGGGEVTAPTLPPITEAPSPSPTAEPVPSEATEATPEGAAEFVRFFTGEVNQAYLDLDPARVTALSAPECQTCQRYVSSISEFAAQGASVSPYRVEVLEVEAPGVTPETSSLTVSVISRIGEVVVTRPDGTELLREAPEDQFVQNVSLIRQESGWLVAEVSS